MRLICGCAGDDAGRAVGHVLLVHQVGQHTARGLMQQHIDVDNRHFGVVQQMLVFGHHFLFEDLVDLGQKIDVKAGIAVGS